MNSFQFVEHRFEKKDLADTSSWWQERLRKSVTELPETWMEALLQQVSPT